MNHLAWYISSKRDAQDLVGGEIYRCGDILGGAVLGNQGAEDRGHGRMINRESSAGPKTGLPREKTKILFLYRSTTATSAPAKPQQKESPPPSPPPRRRDSGSNERGRVRVGEMRFCLQN